ncbi:hypothetical protein C8F01DRAFT_1373037 [Mycena amicta]|nr:hypothetical protein C8F01DRAFT_1373037 [Mycena amicta]
MPSNPQDFLAEVEEPPPPVVLLLAHTNIASPTFQGLLMHEDLELGPPLLTKKSKAVAFVTPPSPAPTYPPPTGSTRISGQVLRGAVPQPVVPKIPVPSGGASRVTESAFEATTGWSQARIDTFIQFVEGLAGARLNPTKAVTFQDPEIMKEIKAQATFPEVDHFVSRWPMDTVLINWCKRTKVDTKNSGEQQKAYAQALDAAMTLRPKKNGKQMRKTVSVRYYHTFGRPVQISTPILHNPAHRTTNNDFIAIDNILGGYHVQPRVHEISVGVQYHDGRGFHTEHYTAFYKNHNQLPYNLNLDIKGDLAIVRTSERGPVNLRMCDRRIADFIAVSLKATINKIQRHRAPKRPLIEILGMPNDYRSPWL